MRVRTLSLLAASLLAGGCGNQNSSTTPPDLSARAPADLGAPPGGDLGAAPGSDGGAGAPDLGMAPLTWTVERSQGADLLSLALGPQLAVAGGTDGIAVVSAFDGIWTPEPTGQPYAIVSLTYDAGAFYFASKSQTSAPTGAVARAADGVAWHSTIANMFPLAIGANPDRVLVGVLTNTGVWPLDDAIAMGPVTFNDWSQFTAARGVDIGWAVKGFTSCGGVTFAVAELINVGAGAPDSHLALFGSADGGQGWAMLLDDAFAQNDGARWEYARGVFCTSPSEVWIAGAATQNATQGLLIHSTDGGLSGTHLNFAAPLDAVWASSPDDVWAAGEHGTLLHSTDRGAHFAPVALPGDAFNRTLSAVAGRGPDELYVVGSTGLILHGTR